ncbi:hypothetical protein IC614_07135 [Allosphingosinicella flava]|uniref:Uncharacterized protein n=1 Tax=Allosphingosinicella flava TaxID=2771430 RepID=A0A7T2LL50_9SPHN|nr:hypothetical protein [Sphingosinicella flava]QPQ54145.1 hypothetical protein IC614_07135 [Sphingosinicella flava]
MRPTIAFTALLLLAACGRGDENLPTAEESQRLNEAAAMLDEAPDVLEAAATAKVEGNLVETGDAPVTDTNGQ